MPFPKLEFPIHETFQSTVQGEGFWVGSLVDFIRLAGCPVGCPWCDTGYSDGGKQTPREMRSLSELLQEIESPRVVISGGEPFIHRHLPDLVQAVLELGKQVSIETSGAFWQDVAPETWITLSPKQHVSANFPVQSAFWDRANEIKLVIATGEELDYYQDYLHTVVDRPIFLQPEWHARDRAIPIIMNLLRQNCSYRLSLQTHKYIGVA
jgi:7-carboxy-7-deazaguanine synthase